MAILARGFLPTTCQTIRISGLLSIKRCESHTDGRVQLNNCYLRRSSMPADCLLPPHLTEESPAPALTLAAGTMAMLCEQLCFPDGESGSRPTGMTPRTRAQATLPGVKA